MSATNNNRLEDRIPAEALSKQEASSDCLHRKVYAGRNPQHARQTGHHRGSNWPRGLIFPNFSSAKEGWLTERPVINLKRLNQLVKTKHLKMEGIHMLKDLLRAGDWMAKIDLKDAYFMLPMSQGDRHLLKFQWKDKTYQFNCLPFGLSSSPWVFTKTTRPDHKVSCGNPVGIGTEDDHLYR